MQLALDSLDRLVDTLEERGPLTAVEAARSLFATPAISEGLACSLLDELTAGDSRVACVGGSVALAGGQADPSLEEAEFVVFDLETTGLSPARDRICELGAVRVRGLELVDSFQSLVNPGIALPEPVARLTGLRQQELRVGAARGRRSCGASWPSPATRCSSRTTRASTSASSSSSCSRSTGGGCPSRRSAPLRSRAGCSRAALRRVGLASLAHFFGVPTAPCHRALPDAEATAQVLVHLIGLAPGARRAAALRAARARGAAQAPRLRQAARWRRARRARPGVYLFHDRHDQVLYVGRARDLRARLRSYFRSERQRPSVEAALLALERIEWRVLGSELEAALEELRLIRELEPPANSRSRRRERGVYLRRRGDDFVVSKKPGPLGPIGSRRRAALAARALAAATEEELAALLEGGPLPRLRAQARAPRREPPLRGGGAAARPDRGARARRRTAAPAATAAGVASLSDRAGRRAGLAERPSSSPAASCGPSGRCRPEAARCVELEAGLACCPAEEDDEPLTAEQAEELLLVGGFVRRPPPELTVLPLDRDRIAAHLKPGPGANRPNGQL